MAARDWPPPSPGPFFPPGRRDHATEIPSPDDEISVAGMSKADKAAIWKYLKQHHPERVAFFDDPTVKRLIAEGATPCFPREIVRAALRGKTTTGAPA